jgi:hypothetical protein
MLDLYTNPRYKLIIHSCSSALGKLLLLQHFLLYQQNL